MSAAARVGDAAGPLTAVLAAFEAGAHSLGEVATRCDLPLDTVRASVDHLVRMGRLEAKELAIGCPTILYPYAREAISDLVTRASFPPVVLQALSFEQMAGERQHRLRDPRVRGAAREGNGRKRDVPRIHRWLVF